MNVVQVNCVYKKGSTGKILYDIHRELLERGVESVVCYGRGERIKEPSVYKTSLEWYARLNKVLTRFVGVMYGGCYFSTNQLISVIKKEKPDIVHLHCINGYFVNIYRLVTWLKNHQIKTVLTLHAEFMYTANCGYALECEKWKTGCGNCPRYKQETKSLFFDRTHISWKKMQKAFQGFDKDLIVTSVSPWLMGRAKQSPILGDKEHTVVLNGLDTGVFHYNDPSVLREKHGLTDEKIIFHATPYFCTDPDHIKGGYYANALAERLQDHNVKVIVAGPYPEGVQVAENVILLGRIYDQAELAKYYSLADVTLLASKKETFSMVTAESLACGTPVVGFQAGAPEQIAIPEYSEFVPYGDLDALERAVEKVMARNENKAEISQSGTRKYAKEKMTEDYYAVYLRFMNKQQGENHEAKKTAISI